MSQWAEIAEKLPMGSDAASKKKRKELFSQCDPNGNGYVSLAETDRLIEILQLREEISKPVMLRAFTAAKNVGGNGTTQAAEDYVEYREFRLLLLYLRQYAELYSMFEEVDSDGDSRISPEDFKKAIPKLQEWGCKLSTEELEGSFGELDADGGGQVLFNEFSDWALKLNLDLPDDDDVEVEVDNKKYKSKAKKGEASGGAKTESTGIDWAALSAKFPTGNSAEDKKQRKAMWRQCDPNGNGYVSLAETGKLIKEMELDDLLVPPVQLRAFNAAKNVHKVREKRPEAYDYVEKDEFKWLFLYLKKYMQLFAMFDAIDKDDDRRIEKKELEQSLPLLKDWGIDIQKSEVGALFAELDSDGGGKILFKEFSDWAIKNNHELISDQAQQMFDLIAARSGKAGENNKSISIKNVVDGLRGMGHNPTSADIKKFDSNKDGSINLEEFVGIAAEFEKRKGVQKEGAPDPQVANMVKLLKKFDKDNSGYLSKAEVKAIMCSMGNDDCLSDAEFKTLLGDIDVNGDGKISLKEMATVLAS